MNIGIFDRYRFWIITTPFIWVGMFIILASLLLLCISFSATEFAVVPYKSLFQFIDGGLEIKPDISSYQALFSDSFYIKALKNSLKLAAISTFFVLIIGYPMAYTISQASDKNRLLLLILIMAPFWTALLIRIYGWIMILKSNGLLNQCFLWLGVTDQPLQLINSQTSIVVGIVYTYLPFMILPIYSSLLKIEPDIIEAAADLGARPFQIFWRIIFPLSLPGVVIGVILVFIPAIGEFVIPDLLGGAKIFTVGKLLWTEFFMNRDWPMASAITILMIIIVVAPIKVVNNILNRG
jgi:putrescine transport system permease protein